jgi:hypothetical protein
VTQRTLRPWQFTIGSLLLVTLAVGTYFAGHPLAFFYIVAILEGGRRWIRACTRCRDSDDGGNVAQRWGSSTADLIVGFFLVGFGCVGLLMIVGAHLGAAEQ